MHQIKPIKKSFTSSRSRSRYIYSGGRPTAMTWFTPGGGGGSGVGYNPHPGCMGSAPLAQICSTILSTAMYHCFQSLEVVSRYRDTQLQVSYHYSHLFNLRPNIHKYRCLNMHLIPTNCYLKQPLGITSIFVFTSALK